MPQAIFDTMARELMIAMRGARTQSELNRRLHYKHNKISKWETSLNKIYWRDFVNLSYACAADLKAGLKEHVGFHGDPKNAKVILRDLSIGISAKEAAAWLHCSQASYGRWLNSKGDVPLSAMMSLMAKSGRLYSFVHHLTRQEMIPTIRQEHEMQMRARRVFAEFPESPLFLSYLELHEYKVMKKHVPGLFAKRLGISLRLEQDMVTALQDNDLLKADSAHKYTPIPSYTNISWTTPESFLQTKSVKLFWMKKGLEALERDRIDQRTCSGGYEIFAFSKAAREKIQTEMAAFHRKIHHILEETKGRTDGMCVYQYQLLNL